MSIVPVNIRLTTNGTEQNVILNKQLINVQQVYLSEVLAVGFNGGVAGGAIVRVKHPQLNNVPIHDRPQDGTMILVNPLTPQMTYQDKLMLKGEIANINSFLISVEMLNGTVATFTELYLILKVVCRPDPYDRLSVAMEDIPQMKGPDPRQMKFL
jgi:hypothetical protein